MSEKGFYLYIDGKPVEVSEAVYLEYYRGERKERYFMEDLKTERFLVDVELQTVTVIPSREDSYERLLEADKQFAANEESTVDTAIKELLLERLEEALHTLSDEEMALIHELFYLNRTEREVSKLFHIAVSTLHQRKQTVLRKLAKLLDKFS